jgi:transcription elongation factor Elf1
MNQTLTCPRCNKSYFVAQLVSGTGTDTHVYMQLYCAGCRMPVPTMHFVVDLTPEFEHVNS